MTLKREPLPYLRLVEADAHKVQTQSSDLALTFGVQTSLFSDASSETLGFIEVSSMQALTFQRLLEEVQPRFIFDLRLVPSFSDTNLTRQTVFALFATYGIRYFDVAGALGVRSKRDAIFNPRLLVPSLLRNVVKTERPLVGPVLFFVEPENMSEAFIREVEAELPNQNGRGWDVRIWQNPVSQNEDVKARRIVFISHANPQDNDVALWLATRLAAEGFDVWSDVTRLIGGELFWDSIEDVIRNRSASVIVLLSKDGHEKPGVLDEVNIAVATERNFGFERFVIPVRLDDLSFGEIRANLARKNIIDASEGLANALKRLVKVLDESGVARRPADGTKALREWQNDRSSSDVVLDQTPWNLLIENCIDILEWPRFLRRFGGLKPSMIHKGHTPKELIAAASGPGGLFTFAEPNEVSAALGNIDTHSHRVEASTSSIIDGSINDIFSCPSWKVFNAMSSIFRAAWDSTCRKRGLAEYRLASGRSCWFPLDGFATKNEVRFIDLNGKTKRRVLVGRSEVKGVYWHYGVEASMNIRSETIRLKAHVIFSEDGRTPIRSSAKQHSLRRSFCKNWWNDRWRDLLSAMLHHLSDGKQVWEIPVSSNQSIVVSGALANHSLTDGSPMRVNLLPEPKVEVGFDQLAEDPREGLMLFGPVPFERNPAKLRIGVIGTLEGLDLFERWSAVFRGPIPTAEAAQGRREVPFPGFEAVFGAEWPARPTITALVSRTDLLNTIRMRDRYQAVYKTVELIVAKIEKATIEDDAVVDIWYVVIPDDVYLYGRPKSSVPKAISVAPVSRFNRRTAKKFAVNTPSLFPEDNKEAQIYHYHADFHHQLKARLLGLRAVTQILRESSMVESVQSSGSDLSDEGSRNLSPIDDDAKAPTARQMQDPVNVAWNLATASFFKAGGRPWKVTTARPGVCYVGLIFKRDELNGSNHACCGAQMFLDSGEGLVFKGAMGPWYSGESRQFHLSRDESERLMTKALDAYREIYDLSPRQVFVHGRTRFSRDELDGFTSAAGPTAEVTGVRITRSSEFKLFGAGDMPVKRGTTLKLSQRVGLIWTSGFIDRLNTYQGRETPNPLRVEICGDSEVRLETVLKDVLTLTKMNFNSSVFADGFPVTMRFADAIGDVLIATGEREVPPLPFRYYI